MNQQGLTVQESAGIHAARGSVRDGLAALQNFENLLRSPRIGLRSLGRMVGELRASCLPISTALGVLIDELAMRQPSAEVLSQLSAFAQASVHDLDGALVRANQREFGAKARLQLEADVRRISAELGALRRLIDLLEAATQARKTELEAAELVGAAINAIALDGAAQGPIVHVHAVVPPGSAQVMTDARVAMQLVGIGIGLVASQGARFVRVQVNCGALDRAQIAILPGSRVEGAVACLIPAVIAPTLRVAQLACSSLGAAFFHDAQGARLCLPARGSNACGGAAPDATP
jgi:hypothetical protein